MVLTRFDTVITYTQLNSFLAGKRGGRGGGSTTKKIMPPGKTLEKRHLKTKNYTEKTKNIIKN